jgi:excisionase family DNA binding protein
VSDLGLNIAPTLLDQLTDDVAAKVLAGMATAAPTTAPGRITLTKAEAAEALGVSVDHLERHVLAEVKVIRSGRLRLIPVAELDAWIARNAARLGEWR